MNEGKTKDGDRYEGKSEEYIRRKKTQHPSFNGNTETRTSVIFQMNIKLCYSAYDS